MLSGGAALVSILSYTSSAGIAVPGVPSPAARAHSITVAPALDTASAVGDTVQLAAMITDSGGTVLAGVVPTWASGDPSVAEVSAAGKLIVMSFLTARDTLVQLEREGESFQASEERAALYTQVAMKSTVVQSSLFAASDTASRAVTEPLVQTSIVSLS